MNSNMKYKDLSLSLKKYQKYWFWERTNVSKYYYMHAVAFVPINTSL